MLKLFDSDIPTILIAGEITWEKVDHVFDEYLSFDGRQCNDLAVLISSQGGDSDAAISLMSLLRGLKVRLTTVAFGKLYSSAIYPLFASSDRRYALCDTTFLFHPTTYELGDEVTINSVKEILDRDNHDNQNFIDLLKQFCVADDVLKGISNPQTSVVLGAQTAHGYGLVNHVVRKFSEIRFGY